MKFVGLDGLKHFWSKAKTWIMGQITAEVTAKIAEIVANAPEDLDTLKEIADWIKTHAKDASAMNTAILANTEAISGKADKNHTHTKSQITDFPTSLKNPNALTINGKTYDGSSAIDAGVQTVANGGTGVSTQADINKAFVGDLELGESDVTDGTEFVSSYASDNGFSDTNAINKPYKRKFSKVWNYIKDKIGSVLGLTANNYGGTAATILDYVKGTPIKVRWDGPGINSAEWYPAFSADGSALEPINRTNIHAGTADKTVNDISIDIPYVAESGQYVIPLGNILEPTSTATESPYTWDIAGFFSIIRPSGHNGSHIQFEAGHGYSHDWSTYAYLDKFDFKYVTTSIKAFQYEGKWWLGLCIVTINQGYFGKMTITYSRGLFTTPTCILYYSRSGGVANEEINNSIQDIPSSWWRQRTICNSITFNDKLYANGVITPRKGTVDGNTVSIGRSDGNITIGDINNKNSGYTTINNDCKILKALFVSGNGDMPSNFEGGCNFGNISVHGKSLFLSGYVPRTYYMYEKRLNTLTTEDKALLKKLFAFMLFNRVSSLNFTTGYKINNTNSNKFINAIGYRYADYEGIINIDNNDDITMSSDFFCNCCNLIGDNGYEGAYKVVDAYDLAGRLLKDDWANFTYLTFYGTFTLLEKV